MAVLEFRFPAGRYHATAWGRNVNEGEPEWPPSPFRLARALMDIWYRHHPGMPAESVEQALELLAGSPRMSVPAATRAAVKCYQHQNDASAWSEADRQPMLDAFVCLGKSDAVFIELPDDAPEDTLETLSTLASGLNYLGRSESWVDARIVGKLPEEAVWNCRPGPGAPVHCLLNHEDYDDLPCHPQTVEKKGRKKEKRSCTWMEALALSSAQLQKEAWSRHPLLRRASYTIESALQPPSPLGRSQAGRSAPRLYTFAFNSKPQPSVAFTVPLAERLRSALMSRHRRACDDDPAKVSQLFSGKDMEGRPLDGHRHAFFWPRDLNLDGKIDHVQVLVPRGLDQDERKAVEGLSRLWGGATVGTLAMLSASPLDDLEAATIVVSATPFVTGRHYKKRDGDFEAWLVKEVCRSCQEMGLPAPVGIERLESLALKNQAAIHWAKFVRQRKSGLPSTGYGFRLVFDKPVRTPFALGRLAHFGLGLFTASID